MAEPDDRELLESFADTSLFALGAAFRDEHPDLVDDVIAQSEAIEAQGLEAWASAESVPLSSAFQTLMTGLALRYARALGG